RSIATKNYCRQSWRNDQVFTRWCRRNYSADCDSTASSVPSSLRRKAATDTSDKSTVPIFESRRCSCATAGHPGFFEALCSDAEGSRSSEYYA
ncbi:unnamed protein product, partial [Amoebophrya sp. A25]